MTFKTMTPKEETPKEETPKEETQPFITYAVPPSGTLPQPKSKVSFFLALVLCFVLMTGSWHAFNYFSVYTLLSDKLDDRFVMMANGLVDITPLDYLLKKEFQ